MAPRARFTIGNIADGGISHPTGRAWGGAATGGGVGSGRSGRSAGGSVSIAIDKAGAAGGMGSVAVGALGAQADATNSATNADSGTRTGPS